MLRLNSLRSSSSRNLIICSVDRLENRSTQSCQRQSGLLTERSTRQPSSRLQCSTAAFHSTPTTEAQQVRLNIGPMKSYCKMLNSGALKPDRNQFAVVNYLQSLYNDIKDFQVAQQEQDGDKRGSLHHLRPYEII